MNRCDDCLFVYADVSPDDVPAELRSLPARYAVHVRAAATGGIERSRPSPEVWSVIEYTCHVRDVMIVQRERLQLALAQHEPTFVPMGRERLVVERRYVEQRVDDVMAQLDDAVTDLARAFEQLTPEQWERTGVYNWPERAVRTMTWLGQHTVHEGVHHLGDVVAVAERLRR